MRIEASRHLEAPRGTSWHLEDGPRALLGLEDGLGRCAEGGGHRRAIRPYSTPERSRRTHRAVTQRIQRAHHVVDHSLRCASLSMPLLRAPPRRVGSAPFRRVKRYLLQHIPLSVRRRLRLRLRPLPPRVRLNCAGHMDPTRLSLRGHARILDRAGISLHCRHADTELSGKSLPSSDAFGG